MTRHRIVVPVILAASLGAVVTVAEPSDVRRIAIEGLERLAELKPETAEWWSTLEQLQTQLEPYGTEGLDALSAEYQTDGRRFTICTISFALGFVGRAHPQEAVAHMTAVLPLPERSDDLCVMGGMTLLGPTAFPALVACGKESSVAEAWVCLLALISQASELSDAIAAMGLQSEDGIQDPPSTRRGIRRVTKRFDDWWSTHKEEVTWSVRTQRLARVVGAK